MLDFRLSPEQLKLQQKARTFALEEILPVAWYYDEHDETPLQVLEKAEVPSGPIYSVADMFKDEHFRARGLFESVESNGRPLAIPAFVPKLSDTPGRTRWPGPKLGAHNEEILGEMLGMSAEEIASLKKSGAI